MARAGRGAGGGDNRGILVHHLVPKGLTFSELKRKTHPQQRRRLAHGGVLDHAADEAELLLEGGGAGSHPGVEPGQGGGAGQRVVAQLQRGEGRREGGDGMLVQVGEAVIGQVQEGEGGEGDERRPRTEDGGKVSVGDGQPGEGGWQVGGGEAGQPPVGDGQLSHPIQPPQLLRCVEAVAGEVVGGAGAGQVWWERGAGAALLLVGGGEDGQQQDQQEGKQHHPEKLIEVKLE